MEDSAVCHIDRVACDFPDLKIIISHGGYPYVSETIMVVQRNANVYLDIAEYEQQPFSEKYIEAANTIISDKVIFSSAARSWTSRNRSPFTGACPSLLKCLRSHVQKRMQDTRPSRIVFLHSVS